MFVYTLLLADRTNGRAYRASRLPVCLSVCRPSATRVLWLNGKLPEQVNRIV